MHMKTGDYLTQDSQSEMIWMGKGSERLSLHGHVEMEHFVRLCQGQHPATGEKLLMRDKGKQRRLCFFGQMSAPKDVSIALLVGGDERIRVWWEEAMRDVAHEIERAIATRVRKGGKENEDRLTSNMVAAVVTHDSSRQLDPQLHTHFCMMNVTFDPVEKRWKSVQPSLLYKYQSYFREVGYNKLAQRMIEAGYELEKSRVVGFNIRGFPPDLRLKFSKRREQIEQLAKEYGVTSQDALQRITTNSRVKKRLVPLAQLQKHWQAECGEAEGVIRQVIATASGTPSKPIPITAKDALAYIEAHLFERRSVVDERILLRDGLEYGRGRFELRELQKEVDARVASGELIRRKGCITSRELLKLERECTEWAYIGRGKHGCFGDSTVVDSTLSVEQTSAARKILNSRDRIIIFEGDAGTGKTRTIREVVKGLKQVGDRPFACAPSSGAAEVLRQELTPDADTLQQLLVNKDLQHRLQGQTILVDEAGLISIRQMHELFNVAYRGDNRLILVGDIKQHSSVEAGDALRALERYGNLEVATLRTIRRQIDFGYRKAVEFLARKKAYQAFDQFEALGAVKEIADPKELFNRAAKDYVSTLLKGKSCLAISPVWSEIYQFTETVRDQLKEKSLLQSEERKVMTFRSFQWTDAQTKDVQNYQPGDVLLFHRNVAAFVKGESVRFVEQQDQEIIVEKDSGERFAFSPKRIASYEVGAEQEIPVAIGERVLIRGNHKPSKLQNGDIVEVVGFEDDHSILLKDGRAIPSDFHQFTHGYATTSHAAQGKTVDRGIVLMSGAGIHAGNLKQAYVSNSRFRESQAIYVSDREAAKDAMATLADRQLAMELVEDRQRRWKIFQKLNEAYDSFNYYRQRVLAALQSPKVKPGVSIHV